MDGRRVDGLTLLPVAGATTTATATATATATSSAAASTAATGLHSPTTASATKKKKRVAFLKRHPKHGALYGKDGSGDSASSDTGAEADADDDDDDNNNDDQEGDEANDHDDDDDDDDDSSSNIHEDKKKRDSKGSRPTASTLPSGRKAPSPERLQQRELHGPGQRQTAPSSSSSSSSTAAASSRLIPPPTEPSAYAPAAPTHKINLAQWQRIPPTSQMLYKSLVLFLCGVFFSLLFNLLQRQHHVTQFPASTPSISIFSSVWWVPVVCGMAAIFVGVTFPYIDYKMSAAHVFKREWSSVMRCVGVFIGINYASAKLPFSTNVQLSLMLALMATALWWMFDRSIRGFVMALIVALGSTFAIQLLVFFGAFRYTQPDFLWVRSWIPCIFFAAGITFGCIGRQLAFDAQMDEYRRIQKKLT